MSNLNRKLAPISDKGWEFIEEEAGEILNVKLTGRKAVDFVGPKGIEYAAVNTGRRDKVDGSVEGVDYSKRRVLPLVEVEVPFKLEIEEFEALVRGAEDVDSDPLVEAAEKVAEAENQAVFFGLEDPKINGIVEAAENPPVEINKDTGVVKPIASAITQLVNEGVEGSYNLLLGPKLYSLLYELDTKGYPLKKKLTNMIGGEIISAPVLDSKGLLVPTRGGDFELISGQDIAVGYRQKLEEEIEFFFTESFTFRVNSPEAVVIFE